MTQLAARTSCRRHNGGDGGDGGDGAMLETVMLAEIDRGVIIMVL